MGKIKDCIKISEYLVPTKEKYPPIGRVILIVIEDCIIDSVVGYYNGVDFICRLYIPTGRQNFIIEDKVTHWMLIM